jgi:ABC-2 type transport system ATP-binding protein
MQNLLTKYPNLQGEKPKTQVNIAFICLFNHIFENTSFMSAILCAQNLKKIYGSKNPFVAVDSISFDLKQGEILGLLGPNGSGKTTTIQMLLGTLALTSGSLFYFGKNFSTHRSEILQHVSFASTYTSLPWTLTLVENLEIFGCLYGLNRKESAKKFDPLLERFGILEKRNQRVASLSAGQITRLMLVKAFFIEPKIVLLDEPTASLDPDIARDICSFLLEQRDKKGLSILFSSHKMEEVMEICDRTIFLKAGKIIANDLPEKLARSVSTFRVKLVITDGLKRTIAIAEKEKFPYVIDHRLIEIAIDEEKIPHFLNALGQSKISYANIKIEEPSLEDFFLQIAKKSL